MSNKEDKFRSVNTILGTQPKLGPFPAEQVFPWAVIAFGSYFLFKAVLHFTWLWTCLIAAWGMATWWVLTGGQSWRFLSKFHKTPYWVRGFPRYQSLLDTKKPSSSQKGKSSFRKNRSSKKKKGF